MVDAITAAVVDADVIVADDMFSAAADILCAAFADGNGVYMADSGGCLKLSFFLMIVVLLLPLILLLRPDHRAHA